MGTTDVTGTASTRMRPRGPAAGLLTFAVVTLFGTACVAPGEPGAGGPTVGSAATPSATATTTATIPADLEAPTATPVAEPPTPMELSRILPLTEAMLPQLPLPAASPAATSEATATASVEPMAAAPSPRGTPTVTTPSEPTATATAVPAIAEGTTAELTNFYLPEVPGGPLNALEQRFFDAGNAERVRAGLPPLTFDATLTQVARTRSQQMADQGYIGHLDPYGYSMYVDLLPYFGVHWYSWVAENIAMNNYADSESPERAVMSLMNSESHRSILLHTGLQRLGVGLVVTPEGRKIYTMILLV